MDMQCVNLFIFFKIYLCMWVHCPFLNFPKIENTKRRYEENTGVAVEWRYQPKAFTHLSTQTNIF